MKIRPFWVLLHRYTGLAMAVFLIVVGHGRVDLAEKTAAGKSGLGWRT